MFINIDILKSFTVPIIVINKKNDEIVYVNKLLTDVIGVSEELFINKKFNSIFKYHSLSIQKNLYSLKDFHLYPHLFRLEVFFEDENLRLFFWERIYEKIIDKETRIEDFWKKVLNNLPIVVFLSSFKPIWVNNVTEKIIGITPEEYLSKSLEEFLTLVHPDDWHKFQDLAFSKSNNNIFLPVVIEYRVKHKDGSWVWVRGHNIPFEIDQNGNINSVLGTAEDISDRKKLEFELIEKNKQLIQTLEKEKEYTKKIKTQKKQIEKLHSRQKKLMQNELDGLREYLALLSNILDSKKEFIFNIQTKLSKFIDDYENNKDIEFLENEIIKECKLQTIYDKIDNIVNKKIEEITQHNNISSKLTKTEQKIVLYLKMLLNAKDISNLLNISNRTVENHIFHIRKKLNIPRDMTINEYFESLPIYSEDSFSQEDLEAF